jgi:hypothetical protein
MDIMMQSTNLPWMIMTEMKTTMNQMEKMLIIEKTWTMMKTSTIMDLLQDQEEVITRTKPQLTSLITSSTTSLPTNNKHLLEMENVSSAERRDISIECLSRKVYLNSNQRNGMAPTQAKHPNTTSKGPKKTNFKEPRKDPNTMVYNLEDEEEDNPFNEFSNKIF